MTPPKSNSTARITLRSYGSPRAELVVSRECAVTRAFAASLSTDMSKDHLVVDGSNIATEGRTAPSLAQLNDAVTDFLKDHSFANVVVIVDATFPNRIDASERAEYEEAILAGELLTPPAGAVGRGDAF